MSEIRIEDWRRIRMYDGLSLYGQVTGHPNPNVGVGDNYTLTSFIVSETDTEVTTASGTVYVLGKHSEMEDDT
jgi:hypothetical protein